MAENLIIQVSLEPRVANNAFEKLGSDAASKSQAAGLKAGKSFGNAFGNQITGSLKSAAVSAVSTIAAFAGINAIKNNFIESTKAAIGFEKSLAEISTILPGNISVTKELENQIRSLSKQFGTSAQEQAKSFYQTVSAGITDQAKATKVLTSANKLSIGGIANVKDSIDILTSIINAYGQENVTAEQAADSLFTAVRLGKTTVSELASSLSQAVPSAKAAGVNIDLLNASVATLTTKGNSTSIAVTKVNALLTALARNGEQLGEGFNITAVKTDGLITVLQRLEKRTGGNSAELLKLLGRQEAVQAAQTLSANGARDLSAAYGQFSNKVGAANKAFNTFKETADFKFKQLTSQIDDLAITMGNRLLPVVLSVARGFASITGLSAGTANAVTNVNDKISGLRKELNTLIDFREKTKEGSLFGLIGPDEKLIEQQTNRITKLREEIAALTMERTNAVIVQKQEEQSNETPTQQTPQLNTEQIQFQVDALTALKEAFIGVGVGASTGLEQAARTAEEVSARIKKFSNESGKALQQGLGQGAGRAFAQFGAALANGDNALEAFTQSLLKAIGEQAVALGTRFILEGTAYLFTPGFQGLGAPLIASGAALAAFGGAIGAISGGSSSGGSSGGGGGSNFDGGIVDNNGTDLLAEPLVASAAEEQQRISINIQGSLIQQEELGEFIASTLNDVKDRRGAVLT